MSNFFGDLGALAWGKLEGPGWWLCRRIGRYEPTLVHVSQMPKVTTPPSFDTALPAAAVLHHLFEWHFVGPPKGTWAERVATVEAANEQRICALADAMHREVVIPFCQKWGAEFWSGMGDWHVHFPVEGPFAGLQLPCDSSRLSGDGYDTVFVSSREVLEAQDEDEAYPPLPDGFIEAAVEFIDTMQLTFDKEDVGLWVPGYHPGKGGM